MDPWPMIKADREAFADYLETLSPEDWNKPSLCEGWTVKGVTTHMLVTPMVPKGKIMLAFLGSGFSLPKMSSKFVNQMTADMSTDEIVAKTRETAGSQAVPPGLKPMGVLGEVVTHTNDVALAVGKPIDLPVEHYVIALDHMKDQQPVIGCKKRIAGLRLVATDTDWSTGDGPVVEGPAGTLLSAMTGRRAALDGLTGDGVEVMRSR